MKASILDIIEHLESAIDLRKIPNLTKLKGHNTAYRIRIGDYRLGFFIEDNNILLARFVHRKDVYKLFP